MTTLLKRYAPSLIFLLLSTVGSLADERDDLIQAIYVNSGMAKQVAASYSAENGEDSAYAPNPVAAEDLPAGQSDQVEAGFGDPAHFDALIRSDEEGLVAALRDGLGQCQRRSHVAAGPAARDRELQRHASLRRCAGPAARSCCRSWRRAMPSKRPTAAQDTTRDVRP